MHSEHILMALSASSVLEGIFPDLDLMFSRVRAAVEKTTTRAFSLPDDDEAQKANDITVF